MSLQVEKLEKNMAKLTVEVPAEQFEAALKTSYNKNKNKFNIPGFRKGKAPRRVLELHVGKDAIKEEAFEIVANEQYRKVLEDNKLVPVSDPEIKDSKFEEGEPLGQQKIFLGFT